MENIGKNEIAAKYNPHQENTFSRSALAGALLSVFPSQVDALELPDNANWYEGAAAIKESVMTKVDEYGTTYIEADGRYFFIDPTKGESNSMPNTLEEDMTAIFEGLKLGDSIKACHIHTHPISLESSSPFGTVQVPSIQDIRSHYQLEQTISIIFGEEFADTNIEAFGAVFNQYGVWYFDGESFPAHAEQIAALQSEISTILRSYITSMNEARYFFSLVELAAIAEKPTPDFDLLQDPKQYEAFVNELIGNPTNLLQRNTVTGDLDLSPLLKFLYETEGVAKTEIENFANQFMRFDDIKSVGGLVSEYNEALRETNNLDRQSQIHNEMLPAIYDLFALQGAKVRFVSYNELTSEPPCAGPNYQPK